MFKIKVFFSLYTLPSWSAELYQPYEDAYEALASAIAHSHAWNGTLSGYFRHMQWEPLGKRRFKIKSFLSSVWTAFLVC